MSDENPEVAAPDPKAQMREALERKNGNAHRSAQAGGGSGPVSGAAHGQVGGKRTFRRKTGG
ncbi:DUF5302 domain-containing protein [Granulicoccus phenolivorans]|uniref:DUF5302 domain-containing protein n=1 Tax=Granulicoccus phenolivorans TaxID=266854 RepID=UPI000478FC2F|nr:DUF5302 domain-containing protein [Granulicoccus phenolivorans]